MNQYYIDGYNLLFQNERGDETLEKQRMWLISFLNEKAYDLNLELTVVFDSKSKENLLSQRSSYHHLSIVYTSYLETADHHILDLLELTKDRKTITIVSSDKMLVGRAKLLGARTISSKAFTHFLTKAKAKKPPALKEQKKTLEAQPPVKPSPKPKQCPQPKLSREALRYLKIFSEKRQGNLLAPSKKPLPCKKEAPLGYTSYLLKIFEKKLKK